MSAFASQDYAAYTGDKTNYIEAAVAGELGKLIGCPPGSQDVTMQKVAYALAGMVKGWYLDEADIRGRFFDACRTLKSEGEPWNESDFARKWRDAMAKAEPRSWPPSSSRLIGARPTHSPQDEPPRSTSPLALRLLKEAGSAKGTITEKYIRETRGLEPNEKALKEFRFHPSVKYSRNPRPCPRFSRRSVPHLGPSPRACM